MSEETPLAKNSFSWQWPVIAITVIAVLAGIQFLRVNKPVEAPVVKNTTSYSTPGSLLSGNVTIGAGEFLSNPITLNRRAKLSGEFQTGSVKERVAVLVVDETNFEKWKQGLEFVSNASTGYVPGGRISPALGPGSYFLVIDNRTNEKTQSVYVKFSLE
jgi:hypothetical protein